MIKALLSTVFSKEGGKAIGGALLRTGMIGVTTQISIKAQSLGKQMTESNEKDLLALVELAKIKNQ